MADFKIKPASGTGNKLILESEDGTDVLTTSDSSATLADGIALGTPASGVATNITGIPAANVSGVLPIGVTGGSGLTAVPKITNIDVWRLTSSFSGGGFITTALERQDTGNPSALGTGMPDPVSGVFTFPTTGHWLVTGTGSTAYAAGAIQFFALEIFLSDGSGGYNSIAEGTWNSANANARLGSTVSSIIDITDLDDDKVKFNIQSSEADAKFVSTDNNRFYFQFICLRSY